MNEGTCGTCRWYKAGLTLSEKRQKVVKVSQVDLACRGREATDETLRKNLPKFGRFLDMRIHDKDDRFVYLSVDFKERIIDDKGHCHITQPKLRTTMEGSLDTKTQITSSTIKGGLFTPDSNLRMPSPIITGKLTSDVESHRPAVGRDDMGCGDWKLC